MFDFDGIENLNIGTACLLLAVAAILSPIVALGGGSNLGDLWGYFIVYACGLAILGFAYISKKPLSILLAIITTMFFIVNDIIFLTPELSQSFGVPYGSMIRISTATLAGIFLLVCLLDTFTDMISTKIRIEFDIGIMMSFGAIMAWLTIWFISNSQAGWTFYSTVGDLAGHLWVLYHIMFTVFAGLAIVSLIMTSTSGKLDSINITKNFSLDNLIFMVGIAMLLVILVMSALGVTFTVIGT